MSPMILPLCCACFLKEITMVSHNINDALTFSPQCYSNAGVWVRSMPAHALQPCLTNHMPI